MPPSLRVVVDLPGLGLRQLAGPPRSDRQVRWVAVSELEDPRPFLEGGELLLTTGMRLDADDPESTAAYVDRLVEAGISALGLGVGLSHAAVPEVLVAAAAERGLCLLEVPERTPFIAVSKAVLALLAAEEYEGMTRAFAAQRDLTRAALSGPAAVVARLARAVDGWVALADPDGVVRHAAPATAAERVPALLPEVVALRRRGLRAAAAVAGADEHVGLRPLGARGTVRGVLVVGTPRPLDRTGQSVVSVGVSLLSLDLERDEPSDAARVAVRRAVLDLLLAGAPVADLPLGVLGWSWLDAATLRWVAVTAGPAEAAAAAAALAAGPGGADRVVVELADDELAVLVRDEPGPLAATTGCLTGIPAGGSAPCRLAGLRAARAQATQSAQATRATHATQAPHATHATHAARAADQDQRDGGLHWFDQLPEQGLLAVVDLPAARAQAASLLGPLEAPRGDLVTSLDAWLTRHGSWDAAAADLGVHRHTLRYRMHRVEELLGRSLDDADLRAQLWVALRVREGPVGAPT